MIRVLLADDQALVRAGFRMLLESADDITIAGEAANGGAAVAMTRELRPDVVLMDLRMPEVDGLTAISRITADPALESVRVVALTTFDDDEYVFGALRAGASGFLIKDVEPAELLQAVRVVARGDALLAPKVTRSIIAAAFGAARQPGTEPASPLYPAGPGAPQSPAAPTGPPFSAGAAAPRAAAGPPGTAGAAPPAGPVLRGPPGAPSPARQDPQIAALTDREREVVTLVAAGLSNDEIAAKLVVSPLTAKTHVSRAMVKVAARDRAQLVVFAYQHGLAAPATG